MIENRSRAVSIERHPKSCGNARRLDLTAKEPPIEITERMHRCNCSGDDRVAHASHVPVTVSRSRDFPSRLSFKEEMSRCQRSRRQKKTSFRGEEPSHRGDRYPCANILKQMFKIPINATPAEKLVSTIIFPCFTISPKIAWTARYRNPPPTCAMIRPSQKSEALARKKNPIAPPRRVVASTAATQVSAGGR